MANTISQPSANPTNKLTAATAATAAWAAVVSIGSLALKNLYPGWYDPETILTVSTAVPTVVGFIAGWLVSDAPNIVVHIEDGK